MPIRKSFKPCIFAVAAILVFATANGGSETLPPGIQVELDSQKPLSLNVTIRSRAEGGVTLALWRLPWGNRKSMLFVPVNSDGECIDNKFYQEEYPNYQKVSIDPNGSISGKIDLQRAIPELGNALKKSDVHLFWAYKAPEELHIAHWSGGWLLIPRQKM